jgi:hypothetical protein
MSQNTSTKKFKANANGKPKPKKAIYQKSLGEK